MMTIHLGRVSMKKTISIVLGFSLFTAALLSLVKTNLLVSDAHFFSKNSMR